MYEEKAKNLTLSTQISCSELQACTARRGSNVVYSAKQEKKQNRLPLMGGRTVRQHHSVVGEAFASENIVGKVNSNFGFDKFRVSMICTLLQSGTEYLTLICHVLPWFFQSPLNI